MAEPSSCCESAVLMIAATTPVSSRPVKMGRKNASEVTKYTRSGSKRPSSPVSCPMRPISTRAGRATSPSRNPNEKLLIRRPAST